MNTDRWLFGKKYVKTRKLEEKMRIMKGHFLILFGLTMLLMIFITIIIFLDYYEEFGYLTTDYVTNDSILKEITIEYEDLTEKEIEDVKETLSFVKPKYLIGIKKFIFTGNISEYCDTCLGQIYEARGLIIIGYRENNCNMRRTITHELMHNWINNDYGDSLGHEIVYDLGDQHVVFWDDKCK